MYNKFSQIIYNKKRIEQKYISYSLFDIKNDNIKELNKIFFSSLSSTGSNIFRYYIYSFFYYTNTHILFLGLFVNYILNVSNFNIIYFCLYLNIIYVLIYSFIRLSIYVFAFNYSRKHKFSNENINLYNTIFIAKYKNKMIGFATIKELNKEKATYSCLDVEKIDW
jgi:hypothetical protein